MWRFYADQMGFSAVANSASFSIAVADLDALYQEHRGLAGRLDPLEKKPRAAGIPSDEVCFQLLPTCTHMSIAARVVSARAFGVKTAA
jgi:hypothetical protein